MSNIQHECNERRILLETNRFDDCDVPTTSSREQIAVEDKCFDYATRIATKIFNGAFFLATEAHINWLISTLHELTRNHECLDASRPWLVYWNIHSLALMGRNLDDDTKLAIINFLQSCRTSEGGYAGGPGHFAHLATTYASICALLELKDKRALDSIDRPLLAQFLKSRQQKDGSLTMHKGGEADVRAIYCATAVASALLLTNTFDIDSAALWTAKCQTYEGGFSGAPGTEAHGGYTFCALAALRLMKRDALIDVDSLLSWLTRRQMAFEGGFNGRTNKLVDGCYSFWQGGAFPIIQDIIAEETKTAIPALCDGGMLIEYLIRCCQDIVRSGLCDKPGKSRDTYHTCYTLSGLSCMLYTQQPVKIASDVEMPQLERTHPLYNVSIKAIDFLHNYFDVSYIHNDDIE